MKIYVVTQGYYSAYKIITATTDPALAEKIRKKFDNEHTPAEIEEFEDAEIMLHPCWFVAFYKDGSLRTLQEETLSAEAYSCLNIVNKDPSDGLYVNVVADSADAAIKIAAERRAEFLANEACII